VAVDSAGALYITERDSHRIRKVTRVAEAGLPVTGAEVTCAKSDVGRMRTRSASPECRRRN